MYYDSVYYKVEIMRLLYLLAALDVIDIKRHRIPYRRNSSFCPPDNWYRVDATESYYTEYLEICSSKREEEDV